MRLLREQTSDYGKLSDVSTSDTVQTYSSAAAGAGSAGAGVSVIVGTGAAASKAGGAAAAGAAGMPNLFNFTDAFPSSSS